MFSHFSYTRLTGTGIALRYLYRFLAALILVPFTVFVALLKITAVIYRFVAIPCSVIVSAIAVYFCVTNGMSADYVIPIIGSGIAAAIHFLLPVMIPFLEDLQFSLKYYVATPVIVRSRLKFTI